jgi:uncharacterized protein (DUF488 family)
VRYRDFGHPSDPAIPRSAKLRSSLATLYTIGHSTRSAEELVRALRTHGIQTLVDIRAFPASRRLPHFNREALERSMRAERIRYVWMKELGGYRKKSRSDSPNTALRNAAFRNYADHMLTAEFKQSVSELLREAELARTAYMCAERVWFQCHRMLVSDWLVAHGYSVLHIDGENTPREHRLTPEAQLVGDDVLYPGDRLF